MQLRKHDMVTIADLHPTNPITGDVVPGYLQHFAITKDCDGDTIPAGVLYPPVDGPVAMSRIRSINGQGLIDQWVQDTTKGPREVPMSPDAAARAVAGDLLDRLDWAYAFGTHEERYFALGKAIGTLKDLKQQIDESFPKNWTDPILTGPNAVLGTYPFGGPDIEKVLAAVKARLLERLTSEAFLRVSEGGSPQEQEDQTCVTGSVNGAAVVGSGSTTGDCLVDTAGPAPNAARSITPKAPLPAQAPGVLEQLIKQCRKDAVAHRQEAQAIKRTHPLATRPAYTCEEVLAQVHEYWANELAAALAAVGRTPEEQDEASRGRRCNEFGEILEDVDGPEAEGRDAGNHHQGNADGACADATHDDVSVGQHQPRRDALLHECGADSSGDGGHRPNLRSDEVAVGRTPREEPNWRELVNVLCSEMGPIEGNDSHYEIPRAIVDPIEEQLDGLRAGSGPPAAKEPQ